jgi:hypothetical protein
MSLDQISAMTNKCFIPVLIDNILSSNPLFILLSRRSVKLDGGATIVLPIAVNTNPTAQSYAGADEFKLAFTEESQGAEFNWSQYAVLIALTGLDDLRNNGVRAVVNLIKAKVELAEASLRQVMGGDLQGDGTGNFGKALLGLKAMVDDGTNVGTYGTVSRTAYPTWKANYSANSGVGRALTMSLLNTNFENASKDNVRPNVILSTHGLYTKYLSLLQPGMRYHETALGDSGFRNLRYQGRPFVVDEQIQTSPLHLMWMLNTNFIDLYVHRERVFRLVPFMQLPLMDAIAAKILWAGQVVGGSPRMQAQVRDLDPTL